MIYCIEDLESEAFRDSPYRVIPNCSCLLNWVRGWLRPEIRGLGKALIGKHSFDGVTNQCAITVTIDADYRKSKMAGKQGIWLLEISINNLRGQLLLFNVITTYQPCQQAITWIENALYRLPLRYAQKMEESEPASTPGPPTSPVVGGYTSII